MEGYLWFTLALLLSPFILLLMSASMLNSSAANERQLRALEQLRALDRAVAHEKEMRSHQRECPVCAEIIAKAARKCIHCGEFIDAFVEDETPEQVEKIAQETPVHLISPVSSITPKNPPANVDPLQAEQFWRKAWLVVTIVFWSPFWGKGLFVVTIVLAAMILRKMFEGN